MLKFTKTDAGPVTTVHVSGTLDEKTDLTSMLGKIGSELHFYCQELSRINSIGIRSWLEYFSHLNKAGTKLHFHECSVAITEQMNAIRNFNSGGQVESVMLPYHCDKCDTDFKVLAMSKDIKANPQGLMETKCKNCGDAHAAFDDMPEEYFLYLEHQK
jgi:DNA-directed RNA polymerase subunit RPC12/RpoP